ncbi:preprotein translocase subunit YajC [Vagococcus sp. DIV0080]|uniref:Preprotein translocase subunit YajC n=1 Tax=Candidatus Vagococcus giribetii TaxID=2230876 RepID=A0ABS3HRZ0_9ENTE|nr:preprotein translocase subunit YajC [Vagococcus sp. DIV0080]MBO0476534.1 preprotein translocase subunit YajC [Vagococcus sp. DIV0080]
MGAMLFPLIIIGGMMFFMTRTQKKQQNQRQELLDSMKIGDEIVTIGGLYGVIHEVNSDKGTIVIDCEGIYLEFERNAIKTVKPGSTPTEEVVETVEVEEVVETEEEKENQ